MWPTCLVRRPCETAIGSRWRRFNFHDLSAVSTNAKQPVPFAARPRPTGAIIPTPRGNTYSTRQAATTCVSASLLFPLLPSLPTPLSFCFSLRPPPFWRYITGVRIILCNDVSSTPTLGVWRSQRPPRRENVHGDVRHSQLPPSTKLSRLYPVSPRCREISSFLSARYATREKVR